MNTSPRLKELRDKLKKLIELKTAKRRKAMRKSGGSSEQPRDGSPHEAPAGGSANDNGIERQP
jgi:hypothetical protein